MVSQLKESRDLTEARALWAQLGDIPVNEDDELDAPFLHFQPGASKVDVWQYFEQRFDCSVVEDLMGAKNV